jgi:hypothetical protein
MPEQHRSTVTRRAALSRLLALGAGATAALALPGAAQAAPVVPAGAGAGAHRQGRRHLPRGDGQRWLQLTADVAEALANPDLDRSGAPTPAPTPARFELKWSRVDDERIATVRFMRLDPNERRRARRWIARQPTGDGHPVIRLRLGSRNASSVQRPERRSLWTGELDLAEEVFLTMVPAVWPQARHVPASVVHDVLCGHHSFLLTGAGVSMYVSPDGRVMT